MRSLLFGICLCGLVVGCGTNRSDEPAKGNAPAPGRTETKQTPMEGPSLAKAVRAADIAKAYNDDVNAAIKRYPEGPMVIEGQIKEMITGRDGTLEIMLKGHDDSRVVVCEFSKDSAKLAQAMVKLAKDGPVTIKGQWNPTLPCLKSSEVVHTSW